MYDNEDVMELDVEEMYLSGDRIFKVLKKIPKGDKISESIDKIYDKNLDLKPKVNDLVIEDSPNSHPEENLEDMSLF